MNNFTINCSFFLDILIFTYYNNTCLLYGDVAQLARASGSYPAGHWFDPNHRYHRKIPHNKMWYFLYKFYSNFFVY